MFQTFMPFIFHWMFSQLFFSTTRTKYPTSYYESMWVMVSDVLKYSIYKMTLCDDPKTWIQAVHWSCSSGFRVKEVKAFCSPFVSSVEGWIAVNNFAFGKQLHEVSKKNVSFCVLRKNNSIRVWNKVREMMTHFFGWSFTLITFLFLSGLNLMENVGWMFCDMITLR